MTIMNHLEKLFAEGKISRRQFLKQAAAAGLAITVGPVLYTNSAGAAVPKKGGHFVQALTGGSASDVLDPSTHASTFPINLQLQLRNCLVEIDDKFQPRPELAESWESSPDAKKWIFNLRKGVEFHDGKSLDAQDVIYSINYHRGEESKSGAKAYLSTIQDIKADGNHRVIFELNAGVADFPFIMSDFHLAIFKDGTKDKEFDKGIGTGGYILEKFEPGVSAITKRNPNYWKEGRAHFDSVETLSVVDTTARTNALKTGQIQAMNRCDRKTVHLFKKTKGVEIMVVPSTTHYTMPMNTTVKPYDDNNARLALKYAIDRDDMVKRILNGYGETGNDHPIGSVNRYFAKNLSKRKYDPEKAKFYMKKAGLEGYAFKLHTSEGAFPGANSAAILYQEHAKKAGIKIDVVQEPSDGYWSNVWMKKDFCMCFWAGRPTEDMMFSVGYAAGAAWNDTKWENKKFNELLVAAKAELDQQKRAQMYADMQEICKDDGGTLIPMFSHMVEANSEKIGHGPISGHMEADGNRSAERWWFK